MRQFTSKELRKVWKDFYIQRGHVDVGAVSLVSDGSTGVLFNVAGMQPLMPYLLGEKHPLGTRLCNVQGCVRTNDIDSVGDKSHVTFFEMLSSMEKATPGFSLKVRLKDGKTSMTESCSMKLLTANFESWSTIAALAAR